MMTIESRLPKKLILSEIPELKSYNWGQKSELLKDVGIQIRKYALTLKPEDSDISYCIADSRDPKKPPLNDLPVVYFRLIFSAERHIALGPPSIRTIDNRRSLLLTNRELESNSLLNDIQSIARQNGLQIPACFISTYVQPIPEEAIPVENIQIGPLPKPPPPTDPWSADSPRRRTYKKTHDSHQPFTGQIPLYAKRVEKKLERNRSCSHFSEMIQNKMLGKSYKSKIQSVNFYEVDDDLVEAMNEQIESYFEKPAKSDRCYSIIDKDDNSFIYLRLIFNKSNIGLNPFNLENKYFLMINKAESQKTDFIKILLIQIQVNAEKYLGEIPVIYKPAARCEKKSDDVSETENKVGSYTDPEKLIDIVKEDSQNFLGEIKIFVEGKRRFSWGANIDKKSGSGSQSERHYTPPNEWIFKS